MTVPESTLINSLPIRIRAQKSHSKTASELAEEVFENAAYSNSSGIVICYKDGVGEVLVSESFDDVGLHFVFTRSTCLCYPHDYDPIGIGSVVQVYWSRSFERVVRGSHIIIQIEKMEVYKCANMLPEQIFVTYNSHVTQGVAVGITERSTSVAFHPSCASKNRYETIKALREGRTEFQMKNKHRENTNRMVEVILAAVPFRVEIRGNIDKIPYIVIRKCGDAPGRDGLAVITTILKNHFMEAYFLQSSEKVYFDSKSCHSNILEKVTVGSIINVMASPAFRSSCYKWYGYDVTMCNRNVTNSVIQKSFVMKNNEILQNKKEKEKPSLKNARIAFKQCLKPQGEVEEEEAKKKKTKPMDLYKLDSKSAQYKHRHILLDDCYSNLDPRMAKKIYDSYFMTRLADNSGMKYNEFGNIEHRRRNQSESDDEQVEMETGIQRTGADYSESMEDGIRKVLEPFGLNRPKKESKASDKPKPSAGIAFLQSTYSKDKERALEPKKGRDNHSKLSPEEVRKLFGSLMDSEGFAVNQKVEERFVLPDSQWRPTERRWIGFHDDFQWVMMATFCPVQEDPPADEPLMGGWWYRRKVPRTHPVGIVERMETRRDIIKDCTVSMMIE